MIHSNLQADDHFLKEYQMVPQLLSLAPHWYRKRFSF